MEQVHQLHTGQLVINRSNGHGYRTFYPFEPKPLNEDPLDCSGAIFEELPDIVSKAHKLGSLLLVGEPGSGKSNLASATEDCCVRQAIAFCNLSVHINAGKATTTEATQQLLTEFCAQTADTQSVLVIDNADYIAYKGGSRSRNRAKNYADFIVPTLIKAMKQPQIITLGTSHNAQWQANHWRWQDEAIDGPQAQLLASFRSRQRFYGKLGNAGLREVVTGRLASEPAKIEPVIRLLLEMKADFHIAQHIDYDLLMHEPDTAVAKVKAGREQRLGTV